MKEYYSEIEKQESLVNTAIDNLNKAIGEYNGLISEEVQNFVTEIVEDMDRYKEERSEKWQESENGQKFQEWMDIWQEIESELVEILEIDRVEVESTELADTLEQSTDSLDEI